MTSSRTLAYVTLCVNMVNRVYDVIVLTENSNMVFLVPVYDKHKTTLVSCNFVEFSGQRPSRVCVLPHSDGFIIACNMHNFSCFFSCPLWTLSVVVIQSYTINKDVTRIMTVNLAHG
jgi:hypothetical protein